MKICYTVQISEVAIVHLYKVAEEMQRTQCKNILIYEGKKQKGVIIWMEDEKIVDLYWNRSENAISETDKKYRKPCISIANNILNDISDSEECLNDTYLAAWNTMPPQRPKYLPAFLFKIVKNIAFNRFYFNHRDKRRKEVSVSFDELEECVAGSSYTDDMIDAKELAGAVNDFIEGLSQEKRVVFVRRYWYFDSVSQISERCEISEEKTKSMLMRLRKSLGEFLGERGLI